MKHLEKKNSKAHVRIADRLLLDPNDPSNDQKISNEASRVCVLPTLMLLLVLINECKYGILGLPYGRRTLVVATPKQGKDGSRDWLMDQVALFIADLTGDLADSVKLIPSFSSCISSYFSFCLSFPACYERGVTRKLKNTVFCPPTVPPLCSLRCPLLKGINTHMSESQVSMLKLTEN